jgi:hypothetical protein
MKIIEKAKEISTRPDGSITFAMYRDEDEPCGWNYVKLRMFMPDSDRQSRMGVDVEKIIGRDLSEILESKDAYVSKLWYRKVELDRNGDIVKLVFH